MTAKVKHNDLHHSVTLVTNQTIRILSELFRFSQGEGPDGATYMIDYIFSNT